MEFCRWWWRSCCRASWCCTWSTWTRASACGSSFTWWRRCWRGAGRAGTTRGAGGIGMRSVYRSVLRACRLGLLHLIRRRFFLLFLFLLSSIVVYPYAESSGFGYYTFRVLMGGVILLTVYAVTFSRGPLFLVIALAIPSFLQHTFVHPHDAGMVPELSRVISLERYGIHRKQ